MPPSRSRAAEAAAAHDPTEDVPLARVFAMAFRSLIDRMHERLAERGWPAMRPSYGFVLVAVRDGPMTGTDVADLLGTTKQAAAKLVDAMEADGLLRRSPHQGDGRAKALELTDGGHRLLAAVEEAYAELEAGWAEVVGRDRVEAIRRDLLTVLRDENGGTLPPIRPTW